jgi:hypothetical protein
VACSRSLSSPRGVTTVGPRGEAGSRRVGRRAVRPLRRRPRPLSVGASRDAGVRRTANPADRTGFPRRDVAPRGSAQPTRREGRRRNGAAQRQRERRARRTDPRTEPHRPTAAHAMGETPPARPSNGASTRRRRHLAGTNPGYYGGDSTRGSAAVSARWVLAQVLRSVVDRSLRSELGCAYATMDR